MCCVKSYYDERGRIKTSLGSCRKNDLILAEAMTIFNMPLYDELRRLMDRQIWSVKNDSSTIWKLQRTRS